MRLGKHKIENRRSCKSMRKIRKEDLVDIWHDRRHLFIFHSYLFEEEREVKSMDILFEFSSEFEIVECGVHIWKDQSGRDNSGGYQTAYGEEEVDNNKQDTYVQQSFL
ncbi:hypothetical protein YC2023_051146 [Brassica napus]